MAAKKICLERLAHKFPAVSWCTSDAWQVTHSTFLTWEVQQVFICPQLITYSYLQYWSLYRTHSIIIFWPLNTSLCGQPWRHLHCEDWCSCVRLLRLFVRVLALYVSVNGLIVLKFMWYFEAFPYDWVFSYLSLFNPGHLNLLAHCCEISLRFQLARLVQHLSGLFSSRIYHVFVLSGIKLQQSTISFKNQSE